MVEKSPDVKSSLADAQEAMLESWMSWKVGIIWVVPPPSNSGNEGL